MDQVTPQDVVNTDQIDMLLGSAGVDTTKAILDAFWKSSDDIIAAMKPQVEQADLSEASANAHALKGSAANLGAIAIAERARLIEDACRAQDSGRALDLMVSLPAELAATRNAFDALLTKAAA